MNNPHFEQAKQAVAEQCGVDSWAELCAGCGVDELDCLYEEVSAWMANEAVKAVINDVIGQADDIIAWVDQYPKRLEEQYYSSGKVNASEIIKKFCRDRPLPFPQQQQQPEQR